MPKKKVSDTMEHFFVFFCTCRRAERLLEYSINAYKPFFQDNFYDISHVFSVVILQV